MNDFEKNVYDNFCFLAKDDFIQKKLKDSYEFPLEFIISENNISFEVYNYLWELIIEQQENISIKEVIKKAYTYLYFQNDYQELKSIIEKENPYNLESKFQSDILFGTAITKYFCGCLNQISKEADFIKIVQDEIIADNKEMLLNKFDYFGPIITRNDMLRNIIIDIMKYYYFLNEKPDEVFNGLNNYFKIDILPAEITTKYQEFFNKNNSDIKIEQIRLIYESAFIALLTQSDFYELDISKEDFLKIIYNHNNSLPENQRIKHELYRLFFDFHIVYDQKINPYLKALTPETHQVLKKINPTYFL